MCIRMKTNNGAVLPAPHNSMLLESSLSDADLLEVSDTKVLETPLNVLLHYAKFHFNGTQSMMSSVQSIVML